MAEMSLGRPHRRAPVEDRRQGEALPMVDGWLGFAVLALAALGLVMVASASIPLGDRLHGDPLYFFWRQVAYLAVGAMLAAVVLRLPLSRLQRLASWALVGGGLLLVLVLLIGQTVNGSTRWLSLGVLNFQPAELAKLTIVLYMADYLVRRHQRLITAWSGLLVPLIVTAVYGVLLYLQPDFGSLVVVAVSTLVLLFLGGAPLHRFLLLALVGVGALAALMVTSPYRVERLTAFLDPWADPFDSGYQLSLALIAFGRGEWWGSGLGSSIQKLSYLSEAHTDFVFAVLAEELGLIGALAVIALFLIFAWRCLVIARAAERQGHHFGALMVYGLGSWLTLQAFINMGVNMGLLPTKGLTLPLISYGGSSVVITCIAIALILRVDLELRYPYRFGGHERRGQ